MIIEIIVTSTAEALLAEQLGANRLELIHAFEHGGMSPTLKTTQQVCNAVSIPVNIMLRSNNDPNFIYSDNDMQIMLNELRFIQHATKANGIVFGALTPDGTINQQQLQLIIANKGRLQLTFHRAIDVGHDIIANYQTILNYTQINCVLTSGAMATALAGFANINNMLQLNPSQQYATILAGSGITPDNVATLISQAPRLQQLHVGTGIRESGQISSAKFKQLVHSIGQPPNN